MREPRLLPSLAITIAGTEKSPTCPGAQREVRGILSCLCFHSGQLLIAIPLGSEREVAMSGGYRGPLLTRVLSADFELGSWILGAGLSRKAREARAGAIGAGWLVPATGSGTDQPACSRHPGPNTTAAASLCFWLTNTPCRKRSHSSLVIEPLRSRSMSAKPAAATASARPYARAN